MTLGWVLGSHVSLVGFGSCVLSSTVSLVIGPSKEADQPNFGSLLVPRRTDGVLAVHSKVFGLASNPHR